MPLVGFADHNNNNNNNNKYKPPDHTKFWMRNYSLIQSGLNYEIVHFHIRPYLSFPTTCCEPIWKRLITALNQFYPLT